MYPPRPLLFPVRPRFPLANNVFCLFEVVDECQERLTNNKRGMLNRSLTFAPQ
jgi:hypothetical protein